jgi:hypothetical protein
MPSKSPEQKKSGKKTADVGSVNRVGRAVTPSRRDPDIGKMIKEIRVPAKKRK